MFYNIYGCKNISLQPYLSHIIKIIAKSFFTRLVFSAVPILDDISHARYDISFACPLAPLSLYNLLYHLLPDGQIAESHE